MSVPSPTARLQPNPLFSHPTKPTHQRTRSQTQIIIPSISHSATRLQCLSNQKLRVESSRNDPRLLNLLGHISIYDSIREYRKEQMKQTACPYPVDSFPRLPTPPPQRQKAQPQPRQPANELHEYLDLQPSRVPSFQDFQAAIEMQIVTLSEIQSTSRKLQALSHSCPMILEGDEKADGMEVEEYQDGDSDSDTASDYDSYDGDGDWRDEEDNDSEDSMTDPESESSECSSPIEDKDVKAAEYFKVIPLTAVIRPGIEMNF